MTVRTSTGDETLVRALSAVGRGVLTCACLHDPSTGDILRVAIDGPVPSDLEALDMRDGKAIEELSKNRPGLHVRSLRPYGRDEGHLLLLTEPDRNSPEIETTLDVVTGLVTRMVEMNVEIESLSNEVVRSYEAINFFYEVNEALTGCMSAQMLAEAILERIMNTVPARCGLIVIPRRSSEHAWCVGAVRGSQEAFEEDDSLEDSKLLLGDVLCDGRTLVLDDVDEAQGTLGQLERLEPQSLLMVPLRWDDSNLGAIVLADNVTPDGVAPFTSAEVKLVETIATPSSSILNTFKLMELRHEIDLARRIQTLLLPAEPPRVSGVDLAGSCRMAGQVGGDLYDYIIPQDGGGVRVVVADVSGHNIAAALMMAVGRAVIRSEAYARHAPKVVTERVNANLYEDLSRSELFLTFFLASYDTKRQVLSYCSAGHNPPLLVRAGRGDRVERLEAAGVPIGILPSFAFEERTTRLHPGDILVIYTDGITEAKSPPPDGSFFGEERLRTVLAENAGATAVSILQSILTEVDNHTQSTQAGDDMTVVVLKVDDDLCQPDS